MSLFVIGDLHFSYAIDKPMDIFGDNWTNHSEKIICDWKEKVKEGDTVILAGDISWAMKKEDAKVDLDIINDLPGKKVILCGNHDYWWSSVSKLTSLYPKMFFLRGNSTGYKEIGICGGRGWICPNDETFTKEDRKVFNRELMRIENSIQSALKNGYKKLYAFLHFPPTYQGEKDSELTHLLNKYNEIEKVFYGHIHDEEGHKACLKGFVNGKEYYLISSDYMNFKLFKIE